MKKTFKLMGLMAMGIAALLTVTTPASAEEAEYRCGDINMDGKVDLADASVSLKLALGIIKDGDDGVVERNGSFYYGDFKIRLTDTIASLKMALGISVGMDIVDPDTGEVIGVSEFVPYNKDEKEEKKKYDELDEQYKLSEQIANLYDYNSIYWPGSIIGLKEDKYMSYEEKVNYYNQKYDIDDYSDYTLEECEEKVRAMCPELEWHFVYGTEEEIDKLRREKETLAKKGKCFLPNIRNGGAIYQNVLLTNGKGSYTEGLGCASLLIYAE